MYYEVLGYYTKEDFQNRKFNILFEGLLSMNEATSLGNEELKNYAIVKVQSSDREEIVILGDNTFRD